MPRMTQKYKAALAARETYGIACESAPQETLYEALQTNWIFWNSKLGIWEKAADPDPPSALLSVRVMGDLTSLETHMLNIRSSLEMRGYRCIKQSNVYINRPPNQLDGRIYLEFLPGGNVA